MSAPRQRQPFDGHHPSWCVGDDELGRHRSVRVVVAGHGRAQASLMSEAGRTWLVLGIMQGVGISALLPLDAAAELGCGLLELVRQARS